MAVGRDRINQRPQDDPQARRVLFGIKDKDGEQGK
jgi:GST-like protein